MRLFTRKAFQFSIFAILLLSISVTSFGQGTAGALSFDGVNDKVLVKRSTTSGGVDIGDPSFNISDVITIEAWLNPESGGGFNVQSVLAKSQRFPTTAQNGYIFPRTNDNWSNIAFLLNFNGLGWRQLTAPYPGKDSWHHVAATYDGSFMRIYIDGVMMNQMAITGTITVNTNPVTIGYQNGYTNEFYRGKIDELRVWNRALSACEIAANKGCEISEQNKLVAYYKFNQGLLGGVANLLENTLKDSGPYQNDGQLFDFGLLSTISNWTAGIVSGTCSPFTPPVVTVGSNSPSIAVGGTLELSASGGVSYSWTGPNGFTSNLQNPVITNITPSAAGLYTVTVTAASGCSVPASITIQVSNPAGALNFDGVNDIVSIPHSASLNPGTGLTVEGWVFPTDGVTPSQSVIGKSTSQVQGYIFPRTDDGWKSFSFYVHLEGLGWSIISAAYPSINEWHHVAATYDGFTMKIYLDGELKATKAITGVISSNQNPVTIGTQPGFSGEFFRGSVDEVRIWNRPLDECEIDNNISCQINPAIQNGLAAYYRLNQGLVGVNNSAVTTVADISGNNNNGTLSNFGLTGNASNWVSGNVSDVVCSQFVPIVATASVNGPILEVGNTVQLTASGGSSYSWTGPNNFTSNQQNPTIPNAQTVNSGVYTVSVADGGCTSNANTKITVAFKAGSLDFDGVDDLVTVPTNNSLNITDNITMEAWIYPTDGTKAIQNVMSKSTAGTNNGYIFPRTDDGWKTVSFFLHLNGQWKVLTAEYPGINQWNHVSATYDGFFMRIYINGALAATTEASGKITTNGNNLVLGQQPGFVEYYRGKVEEARIWSRALNQCEVINNMNCELQTQQTGLVAYYKFNQGFVNAPNATDNILNDASPNGNNGTLSNFTLDGLTSNWSDFKVNGTCSTYAEPPVTAQANASVFGIGSTIRLFANGGSAYTWTGPNNFAASLPDPLIQNAQIINSGTYTVAVPFINCTIFRSVRLTVTPLPAVQANGPTVICPSSVVKLSIGTTGTAYQWYRNNEPITGADSAVHSASQSGSYHVAVTVNGNVQVSAPIEVSVVDNLAPVPNVAQLPVLYLTAPATAPRPTATDNCSGVVEAVSSDPITFTQAGTYTIRWVYNDGNDNIATQTQQVVVERNDITPPVLNNLPANLTVNCNAVPAPPVVTAIDDVDGVVAVTFSEVSTRNPNINSPGHYSYTISRTWSAVDASNNTVTTTRTVTVIDDQAPVFGTVNNINVPTAPNMAGANVSYSVTAVDGCNSPVAYTYSILSGTFFNIGTTTVQVTATDVSGNSSTASFTVRVFDNQAPSITAPANVIVNTDAGVNYATNVTLGLPTVSDNSGSGVTITNNAPAQYPLGQTTVTWTATDAAGNSATATQTVTVKDGEAPVLTAPATVTTVTNNSQPFATNVALGTATASDNSGFAAITNNAPNQFPIGQTTVTWTATDASGNQTTATQLVIVEDKEAPVLIAPSNITVSTNPGVNFASGVNLGTAGGSDNSGLAVNITNNAPSVYNLGTNNVTWTITDAFGNAATGVQIVTVIDTEAPVISGVTNVVVDAPLGSNTANVTSLGNPTATDNVQLVSLTNNATGTVYPIGTTVVEWTAIDAAGNKTTGIQLVIVRDITPPVLNGVPANVNAGCASIPSVATVSATDNFDQNVVVAFTQTSTKGTNSAQASFYNYVITRTWTATDAANNQVSATQTITVTDKEAPVMPQPVNIAANSSAGTCGATVNYTVTATDNCESPITYTYSKASGTVFPVGVTTVEVTATDASGNNISRSFTVTVTDNQLPTIVAPANINVTIGATINLGTATASDNCGVPVVTNNAPATFPVGVTVVTWTATDAAGNTASASQTVTVNPLVSNCTSSITVTPENNTFTGGIPTNIYLGYGPQRVTLRANATGGTSYTYTWRAVSGNGSLSSTSSAQPVFAPTAAGNYTFEVSVRTQSGCVSVSRVTICVRDIRVKDADDDKCDHKSHGSKDCKHGKHNHGKCDHKAHDKKKCKDKYDDGDDDNDECDHKAHDHKHCKHKGHKHSSCDHKAHTSKSCKNKYDDKHDHDDDDDDDVAKVYLCHVPPGNSGNPQTLKISINAVEAHLTNHAGDRLGSCADQGCAVTPPPPVCSTTINVVPENNTYTGGVSTNIYLGYGPQKVILQANATGGSGYTYSWRSISGGGSLSNTTSNQPVFCPTKEGYYTFEVRVTTQAGCVSTSQVSICVQDVRVEDDCDDWDWGWNWNWWSWWSYNNNSNSSKVYITRRNGNSNNFSILEVKTSDVAAHLQRYPNDRLGKGLNGCVSNTPTSSVLSSNLVTTVTSELPTVNNGKIITQPKSIADLEIKVMGNPSRNFFTIKMESKHELPVQVRIFDINGRPMESKANQLPNSTIQVGHNLGSGTYYAEFVQGKTRKVVQLIKVR